MKICLMSDPHGKLPLKLPENHLTLIAGDICPLYDHTVNFQSKWINHDFDKWAQNISPQVVGCWGNHDFIGEYLFKKQNVKFINKNNWVLMEEGMLKGLPFSIYFTSYQLPFFDWAFNEPEEKMAAMYAKIPVGTDIIVSHGPPLGYGDYVSRGENTGSKALLDAIDRVKPKLVVFGHIHSGYGNYQRNDSLLINASIVNEKYNVVNAPIVIDSETWKII